VSPSQFQLEGASLEEVTARAHAEYGPHAKIIATEAVTTGGIAGFFAQRHYKVTIEVPGDTAQDAHAFDLPARPGRRRAHPAHAFDLPARAGIAALLDDADSTDVSIRQQSAAPRLSTASVDFAAIMADLTTNTLAEPEVLIPRGPKPLSGAGDLVLIIGLGRDALRVARQMSTTVPGSALRIAGDLVVEGIARVSDRRSALAARAAGVESGHSIIVAFGLSTAKLDFVKSDALSRVHPDQVWVVVDASRKEEDTAHWVRGVQETVRVDGIAVRGREFTATPETVNDFDLPVGWTEAVR
jgi:hypothetical protein